jgi:hypothetical protein
MVPQAGTFWHFFTGTQAEDPFYDFKDSIAFCCGDKGAKIG